MSVDELEMQPGEEPLPFQTGLPQMAVTNVFVRSDVNGMPSVDVFGHRFMRVRLDC
jgi:hypothetical protein